MLFCSLISKAIYTISAGTFLEFIVIHSFNHSLSLIQSHGLSYFPWDSDAHTCFQVCLLFWATVTCPSCQVDIPRGVSKSQLRVTISKIDLSSTIPYTQTRHAEIPFVRQEIEHQCKLSCPSSIHIHFITLSWNYSLLSHDHWSISLALRVQ